MTDECTKIPWSDVQPGDILMHENGDRLTVEDQYFGSAITPLGRYHPDHLRDIGGFTPHRPVPSTPTEPGPYLDKDGVLCDMRSRTGVWKDTTTDHFHSSEYMHHRAPFTRLVPMPTEQQVREALESKAPRFGEVAPWPVLAAAVMSLLSTEVDRG